MLTKRIVPCLDIKNGRTVKGVNFVNLIDAGDPVVLAKQYAELGADELVFLDIAATLENRGTTLDMVFLLKNVKLVFKVFYERKRHKKRQATYITPLRPYTFAAFPPWRIKQELVV